MEELEEQIREIVQRETNAWNNKNVEEFLSIFHEDMVWPWPPTNMAHNPIEWVMEMGRFDYDRWKCTYQAFFNNHDLIYNHREIVKIVISTECDGAFAVVDIDTQWQDKLHGEIMRWEGRVCKVYSKVKNQWKLTMHTGVLKY